MKHCRNIMSIRPEEGLSLWYPFLLNEVMLARAGSDTPFYLISPWLTDFTLDLSAGRGFPDLGIHQGKFTLTTFCNAYIRAGGRLRILVVYPENVDWRGNNVKETLRLVRPFHNHSSGRVEVRLHKKIHVKLYVGLGGVLSGSANATSSAMHYNVENLDYFADKEEMDTRRSNADRLWNDRSNLEDWQSIINHY